MPENWLEKIRPGDKVYYSLRNYPGRLRTATVEYVGRGVVQGQGVSGNLPDTDPRRIRQTDTPQEGQEFQVVVHLQDDQPDQPLRVGATGRVTIFAGGGFPVVNGLATILHTIFSWLDYLYPKPSLLVVALVVAMIIGIIAYLGKSDVFDEAIAAFSVAYADQNEKDHAVLKRAIQDGKVEAVLEEPK